MRNSIFKVLVLLMIQGLFSFNLSAQQAKIFLPWFETINMRSDFKLSSTRLLKTYIENTGRYEVVVQSVADSAIVSLDQTNIIIERAKAKSAQYFVIGILNRLGEAVIVNVSMYETSSGTRIWFDQLKALTPDDLDPIFQRIGKNIGTPNKATTEDDIYSVSKNEEQNLAQKQSNNNFGFGLGGIMMAGSKINSENSTLSTIQLGWSYDARDFFFDLNPAFSFNNSGSTILGTSIEMLKPLTSNSNTPFVGGGVSMSFSNFKQNYDTYSGAGLSALIGGGYIFKRTSTASLRGSLHFMYNFYDMKQTSYNYYPSSYSQTLNLGATMGFLLRIEILFKR